MGRINPWTKAEIALLRDGKEVPTRSANACRIKRTRLGVKRSRPKPAPKEPRIVIPRQRPSWWARAARYLASGMTTSEVARAVGKSFQAVAYATNPEVRARMSETALRAYRIKGQKRNSTPDHKRTAARKVARKQWFEAGMPGHVETFYRRLDCL